MSDQDIIQTVGIMIVSAALLVLVSRLVRMPSIVAYILAGLVLGPILGLVSLDPPGPTDAEDLRESETEMVEGESGEPPGQDSEQPSVVQGIGQGAGETHGTHADAVGHSTLHIISELGIALLLFLVGLELSLERIRDVGKVALFAGIGQVVFTAVGGFILSWLIGFGLMESIFLAIALTFSSTVVVVKLLDQKKELHSLYGRIAVGIFLVQDLVVIIMLTFLAGLGRAGEEQDALATALSLLWAFVGMGMLLALALVSSRYLLPMLFRWAGPWPQMTFIWSICWCFIFVKLAEKTGLSLEIGAFLAGISLAQLSGAEDLRRRVHPLMNFFIAIFFVSLGAQMDLSAARDDWWRAAILSLFVLIGNPFIFIWIIARCGYSERTSFLTSVTVAQISEFSFIFARMGLAAGLIAANILSMVMVVGLVTIAVSSYMILYNHPLYAICKKLGLLRMFKAGQVDEEEPERTLSGHIVVVGMNPLGRRLATDLHRSGQTVLAVDTDERKLSGLPCRTMVGNIDYLSMVEETALEHAKLGISALQIEDTNNLFAYRCREFGIPVAIHAFDRSVLDDLRRLGVSYLIDAKAQANREMEEQLLAYAASAAEASGSAGESNSEQDADAMGR